MNAPIPYRNTPRASKGNAFCWDDGTPSIFMGTRTFMANANGESVSQTAARAVHQFEQDTGRSRGTVYGISAKSEKLAEEFQHRVHVNSKGRAPGHYKG
jgi:hypothetical protein